MKCAWIREAADDLTAEEYEVDSIVAHSGTGGARRYRVRWLGYTAEDDTWEAASTIQHTSAFQFYLQQP